MKLCKFITAFSLSLAASCSIAYAADIDVLYNDSDVTLHGEIIEDRAMVDIASLQENFGISASAGGDILTIKKGGKTITYNRRENTISDSDGTQIKTDSIPDADTELLPLRAIAGSLGMSIGYDSSENKIVLIDYDEMLNRMQTESPELYKFLTFRFCMPERGLSVSDLTMDFDVKLPEDNIKLSLKLTQNGAMYDGITSSDTTLENLSFISKDLNLAFEDVTLDGIFDLNSGCIYLKTNAITKLADAFPAYADQLKAAATVFDENTWYKLSLEEYYSTIFSIAEEATGIPMLYDTQELTDMVKNIYKEGFTYGSSLRASFDGGACDSIYAYENAEETFDAFESLIDAGIFKITADNDKNTELDFLLSKNLLKEYIKSVFISDGVDNLWSDETDKEFEQLPFDVNMDMRFSAKDSLITGLTLTLNFSATDEEIPSDVNFSITASSSIDTSSDAEPISPPESAASLIPIIESLEKIFQSQS